MVVISREVDSEKSGEWRVESGPMSVRRLVIYTVPNKGCPKRRTNNYNTILLFVNASRPLIFKTGLRLWFPTIRGKQFPNC